MVTKSWALQFEPVAVDSSLFSEGLGCFPHGRRNVRVKDVAVFCGPLNHAQQHERRAADDDSGELEFTCGEQLVERWDYLRWLHLDGHGYHYK